MQYGLFLAKTVTIVLAIGVLALLIFSLARRDKGVEGLEVVHLNDKLDGYRLGQEQPVLIY